MPTDPRTLWRGAIRSLIVLPLLALSFAPLSGSTPSTPGRTPARPAVASPDARFGAIAAAPGGPNTPLGGSMAEVSPVPTPSTAAAVPATVAPPAPTGVVKPAPAAVATAVAVPARAPVRAPARSLSRLNVAAGAARPIETRDEPGGPREQHADSTRLGCYGNGSDGARVQAVYVHPLSGPDRFAAVVPSIRQWAANVDATFDRSAQQTGGDRHVRFVTDSGAPGCQLVVEEVAVSARAIANFAAMTTELAAQAVFDQGSRKYLLWVDATTYCGISNSLGDDSPGQANTNNDSGAAYARVDSDCWGYGEAHELMHTLGAVQPSAPHALSGFHCSDGYDVMCYAAGSGGTAAPVCPPSNLAYFDCNHDDYFSTNPAPGSYLATHWNTANSRFLAADWSDPAPQKPVGLLNNLLG